MVTLYVGTPGFSVGACVGDAVGMGGNVGLVSAGSGVGAAGASEGWVGGRGTDGDDVGAGDGDGVG